MEPDVVRVERSGAHAVVTIDHPKANAISRAVIEQLTAAFDQLETDPTVRAVVVTGAGPRFFAAGADIKEFPERAREGRAASGGMPLATRMMEYPKPTIAAVNGIAFGGGCELAMACDVRIAVRSATFGQPEINLGIIPGFGGTQRLPRLVGEGRARELNLTGEPISADEAYALGLANRVGPDVELFDTVLAWARKLSEQAPLAVEAIKRVSAAADVESGIESEKQAFVQVLASEDAREGISAFLQKRRPRFQGQ